MGKKPNAGHPGHKVDRSGLEKIFAAQDSPVSAQVIKTRESGCPKGFGFVAMASAMRLVHGNAGVATVSAAPVLEPVAASDRVCHPHPVTTRAGMTRFS